MATVLQDYRDWKDAVADLSADDFVYFDPPYIGADVHVYSDGDINHGELVAHLLHAPYRWFLSEYDRPIYRESFAPL